MIRGFFIYIPQVAGESVPMAIGKVVGSQPAPLPATQGVGQAGNQREGWQGSRLACSPKCNAGEPHKLP